MAAHLSISIQLTAWKVKVQGESQISVSEQNIRDRLGWAGAARGIKPKWIGFSLEFKVFIGGMKPKCCVRAN